MQNDGSDERIHSVEIQAENSVALKDNLLAVVVPARFFDEDQIKAIIAEWKCEVVGYHVKSVFTPTYLMSLLFDKVREILVQDGQLP